jgi:hypothetical protein
MNIYFSIQLKKVNDINHYLPQDCNIQRVIYNENTLQKNYN